MFTKLDDWTPNTTNKNFNTTDNFLWYQVEQNLNTSLYVFNNVYSPCSNTEPQFSNKLCLSPGHYYPQDLIIKKIKIIKNNYSPQGILLNLLHESGHFVIFSQIDAREYCKHSWT